MRSRRGRESAGDDPVGSGGGPSERTWGVSADLTGEALEAALGLWDHREARFGLRQMRAALRPHVSFLVGESDQPAELARTREGAALLGLPAGAVEPGRLATPDVEALLERVRALTRGWSRP